MVEAFLLISDRLGRVAATEGRLALPMMLAQRYDTALAAGTIAAAGTLGIIMPPAIMLFFSPISSVRRWPQCFSGLSSHR